MAARTVSVLITGDASGLDESLAKSAAAADAAGISIGDSMDAATAKTGGLFEKLGAKVEALGIPGGAAFSKIGSGIADADTKGEKFGQTLSTIGGVTLAAGAAGFAVFAGESVHLAETFQSTVTSIAANADIPISAAKKIGQAFLDTAGTTIYSGQEIASAYAGVAGQLGATQGKALNASQAMTVMKASMDLAEASGESLGTSTKTLAATMQAYGAKAQDAGLYSDVLYNTSRQTGQSVDAVGASFQKLHSTLGAVTPDVGQLGGILVELTEHGETGRKALAAVNTTLNGMLAPTAAVAASQKFLGVTVFNSAGQFVGMGNLIQQLQPKLAGMNEQQQLATLKAIGMGTANKALLTTILSGPAAFDKATQAASEQGNAHAAAQKQAQTLQHQVDTLKASVEDEATKFGSFLIPKLEETGKVIAGVITWFEKHKTAAEILAGVIGGALATAIGVFAINTGVKMVGSVKQALTSIGLLSAGEDENVAATQELAGAIQKLELQLAGLSAPMSETVDASEAVAAAWDAMGAAADEAQAGIDLLEESLPELDAEFEETGVAADSAFGPIGLAIMAVVAIGMLVVQHWKAIEGALVDAWHGIEDAADDVWHGIVTAWHAIEDGVKAAIDFLVNLFLNFTPEGLLIKHWTQVESDAKAVWGDIVGFFTGIPGKIVGALDALGGDIEGVAKAAWNDFSSAVSSGWNDEVSFWTNLPGKILSALGDAGSKLLQWGKDLVGGIVSGVGTAASDIGKALESAIKSGWNSVKGALNSIPVVGSALSAIGLATGGYVTSPTLALVGEAGPEFVIPEAQLQSQFASGVSPLGPRLAAAAGAAAPFGGTPGSPAGSGVAPIINIAPITNATPQEIAAEVGYAVRIAMGGNS